MGRRDTLLGGGIKGFLKIPGRGKKGLHRGVCFAYISHGCVTKHPLCLETGGQGGFPPASFFQTGVRHLYSPPLLRTTFFQPGRYPGRFSGETKLLAVETSPFWRKTFWQHLGGQKKRNVF